MGAVAPRTPLYAGATIGGGATLFQECEISRITTLETDNVALKLRMENLVKLVEEQAEWLKRQSALLASQSSLIEAMATEQDTMRDKIRMLEDRLTLAEFVAEMAQPDVHQEDEVMVPVIMPTQRPLTTEEIAEVLQESQGIL